MSKKVKNAHHKFSDDVMSADIFVNSQSPKDIHFKMI